MTMLILPGSGLDPIDSKVLRPITTGIPHVRFLKNRMSLGNFHMRSLLAPMELSSPAATTTEMIIRETKEIKRQQGP